MVERTASFGYWLRRRRKALDLTQEALAEAVSCSRFAIRKIEADERRPSRRLAERLAERLAIPAEERTVFLDAARAVHSAEGLSLNLSTGTDSASNGSNAAPARLEINTPAARQDTLAEAPDAGEHGLNRIPFVGRESEFGQLVGLLARLTSGHGHVVLLEGEPGVGKSRLMREVSRHAQELGLRTLVANCYEIERNMPYQPIIELIGQALDQCSRPMLERLAPIALAEVAALVPLVAERVPNLPTLSAQHVEARQVRLFSAIEQLFDALAAGGQLLVIIDDIHWIDDASAQFLHYLARHARQRRSLVLLGYRGEEVAADERLTMLLESVRREPHARHFLLQRLSLADTHAFLAQAADSALATPGLGEWLHRETDGHPFFLISILQSLLEQGRFSADSGWRPPTQPEHFPSITAPTLPEAVRASVRSRLTRVPRGARPILDVAAVLGRRFDFDLLQAVTKESEAVLADALEALAKRRLLREDAEVGVYDFSHDKIREAVYADIGSTRRMLLHRSVAEALEQLPSGDIAGRAARLAEHYERAQAWMKAVGYLDQAADRSQALFATREALGLLDRAVALGEAHPAAVARDVLLRLYERRGSVRAQAGQLAGAVADFERVIGAARVDGTRERERDLLIQLGMAYRRADDYERATECLGAALATTRAMYDEQRAADTLYHLGTVAWSNGRNAQAIACHQEAVEISERLGLTSLVAVQAYHGRGEAYFAAGEPESAISCYERSIALAQRIGDKSYECENLMMIGWACSGWMGLGDYSRTTAQCEAALEIARSADLEWHIGPILIARDLAQACTGHYAAAWSSMNTTLTRLESLNLPRYQIMACNMLGHLLLGLGLTTQAAELLQRGLDVAERAGIRYWKALLEANLAIARLRSGEHEDGAVIAANLAQLEQNSEGWILVRCLDALAEICLARGAIDRSIAFADRLLALALAGNMREQIATAHRWRGAALVAQGAHAPAAAELEQAGRLARTLGRSRLEWDIHRASARLHRHTKDSAAATLHEQSADAIRAQITADLRGSALRFAAAESG